jgi:hypothetical protein
VTAFASTDEFFQRYGLDDATDEEIARAEGLLAMATALIQDEAEQHIFLVADDEITRIGTTDERILLPERPVVSVASLLLDGQPLTGWYVDGDAIVRRQPIYWWRQFSSPLEVGGTPFLLGSSFGRPDQTLTITYTHGYATPPARFKAICLEAVVRVWVNPGAVARETVGDTSTVYDNMRFSPTGMMLTSDERKSIRRLIGTRAGTVSLT